MSWTNLIKPITDLVSEYIEDPDKKAQIELEISKLEVEMSKELLRTSTTPRVDAFVKILIAVRDIIIPLFRPLGTAAMTMFAAYCTYKEIPLAGATEAMLYGAFPAWGTSRHMLEGKKIKRVQSSEGWEEGFD